MNETTLFGLFFVSIVTLSVIGIIMRARASMKLFKNVKKEDISPAEMRDAFRKEAAHPVWQAYQRTVLLITIAFIGYWYWTWMEVAGQAIPSPWRDYMLYGIFGLQLAIASVIILRTVIMLISTVSNSTAVDPIADPKSSWTMLERKLLFLVFAVTFLAAFVPIYFLVKQA
jgi:hypothetical protein